jgi:hypothetical protein
LGTEHLEHDHGALVFLKDGCNTAGYLGTEWLDPH